LDQRLLICRVGESEQRPLGSFWPHSDGDPTDNFSPSISPRPPGEPGAGDEYSPDRMQDEGSIRSRGDTCTLCRMHGPGIMPMQHDSCATFALHHAPCTMRMHHICNVHALHCLAGGTGNAALLQISLSMLFSNTQLVRWTALQSAGTIVACCAVQSPAPPERKWTGVGGWRLYRLTAHATIERSYKLGRKAHITSSFQYYTALSLYLCLPDLRANRRLCHKSVCCLLSVTNCTPGHPRGSIIIA
jgi:hypothetical protein